MTARPSLQPVQALDLDTRRALVRKFCHDCRTPLAVVAEFASLVRDELDPAEAQDSVELLDLISDRVVDLEGIISDLEFLHRVMNAKDRPVERIDVSEFLATLKPQLQQVLAPLGATIHFGKEVGFDDLYCDAAAFDRAIRCTILSLVRTAPRGGEVILRTVCDRDASAILFVIARRDLMPDAAEEERIMDPRQHQEARDEHLNFRLNVAASMVGHCGGLFEIVRGAEHRAFCIRMPTIASGVARPDRDVSDDREPPRRQITTAFQGGSRREL